MSTSAQPDSGIEQLLHSENELLPPKSLVENARLKDYAAEYKRSIEDPEAFWARLAGELGGKATTGTTNPDPVDKQIVQNVLAGTNAMVFAVNCAPQAPCIPRSKNTPPDCASCSSFRR